MIFLNVNKYTSLMHRCISFHIFRKDARSLTCMMHYMHDAYANLLKHAYDTRTDFLKHAWCICMFLKHACFTHKTRTVTCMYMKPVCNRIITCHYHLSFSHHACLYMKTCMFTCTLFQGCCIGLILVLLVT